MDQFGKENQMGLDVEEIKAGVEVKSTQRRLVKSDFKIIKDNGNANWIEEEREVKHAIELFISSRVKEAEELLLKKYGSSLFHTHGLGVLSMLKGLMTFDSKDIAYAMDSLRNTAEASSYLRKEQSLVSSFSGMIFGGAQKNRISVIKSMTFLERQVELCHAESYLLKALLSILTDSNFTTFLKEGMAIRQSYATYKACYKFLAKLYTEGGADALIENRIDAVFITGVYLGIGGFNLILSLLPERLLKIIEFIGFSGQLEFGMQCLAIGGAWPVNQLLIQRSKKIPPKKIMKQKSALNFYCDKIPQETGCGTRKFMCEIMLHIYHVFIAGLIPVPACNVPVAKAMADRGLSEYPTSFLFLMARGKIYQIQRELKEAVDQFEKVVHIQKDWRQLAHVCFWEMGISLAADGKYQEAADYFGILLKENEWSKGIYAYIRAVLLYEVDPVKNKAEVAELLQSVPNYMKKIAGKSIPLEKFVARKARKFFFQNQRLMFPVLEILYIWNGFDLIPEKRLYELVEDLGKALTDLDRQQEEGKEKEKEIPYSSFYDDLCLVRFFKGLATRELAYPAAHLLEPEEKLVARTISSEQKKALDYAAKQLEYISLQADEIEFDHWILPFARYELASLHVREGDYVKAKSDYDAALNGGYTDDEAGKQKKKASMETALHIKVHNAIMKLKCLKALRGLEIDNSQSIGELSPSGELSPGSDMGSANELG